MTRFIVANKFLTYKLYKYKMIYLYNGTKKVGTTCPGGGKFIY